MSKNQKIKIIIFTSIILISSIILVLLATNAYSYPEHSDFGKVSITMDNTNNKIIINNPSNLTLSYLIQDNQGIDESLIGQIRSDQNSINTLTNEIRSLEVSLTNRNNQKASKSQEYNNNNLLITSAESQIDSLQAEKLRAADTINTLENSINSLLHQANNVSVTKEENELNGYGMGFWNLTEDQVIVSNNTNMYTMESIYTNYDVCLSKVDRTVGKVTNNHSIFTSCGGKEGVKVTKSLCECEFNGLLEVLNHKRQLIESEAYSLRDQKDKLQRDIESYDAEIETLINAITVYDDEMSTLQNEINTLNSDISTLEFQIASKQAQISTIQRQMPSIAMPTSGYINLSSNEIKYSDISTTEKNVILWIKSTDGSNTYNNYFFVSIPESTPQVSKYIVTFDPVGGTVSKDSIEVTNESVYGTLPTAAKDGYTFIGWFTKKENGTQIQSDTVVNLTDNQTLYAHYTEKENNSSYNITEVSENDKDKIINQLFKEDSKVHIYDIDVENGKKTAIIVPMPDKMNKNDNIKVYEIVNGKKTSINYTIDSNNNIIFETDHDGRFAIIDEKKTIENNTNNTNNENNENTNNSSETVKYDIKELNEKETENIKKEFSDAKDIYIFESTISDGDKGKEIAYNIDLPKGYSATDNIVVYAYTNEEKIIVPHTIENGKILFKTTLTGKFVIAKYKSNTNATTTNNSETILNPQTGDINVKVIVILLVLAIIVSGISLIFIIKNNNKK